MTLKIAVCQALITIVCSVLMPPALCAIWEPVSLTGGGVTWHRGSALIVDGQTVPPAYDLAAHGARHPVLFTTSFAAPTAPGGKLDIFFGTSFSPPMVNLISKTINLTSLAWEGYNKSENCGGAGIPCFTNLPAGTIVWDGVIGAPLGATSPVPLVDNGNGTYTASWTVPVRSEWFGLFQGQPFSLVIAVPEPASGALMVVGLCLVCYLARRAKHRGH